MAIYLSRKKGGTVATPITPSNSSPAQMTADTPVNPTANGYAIESYSSITPSNSSPATITSGSIYKASANGKAVASVTNVTPSNTPTSVAANDVVKLGGSGFIVDSVPFVQGSKSVTATTSQQTVSPDTGYDSMAEVVVNPQVHTQTYTPAEDTAANDMGVNNNYRYVDTSGMVAPTSITPSNWSPAEMTTGNAYTPSANALAIEYGKLQQATPSNSSPFSVSGGIAYNIGPTSSASGYLIESYSNVTPSNSTPVALTSGNIAKLGGNGYAIASYDSVTPSSTPASVASGDIVKIGGSGVIVDSIPTPTSVTPSDSTPPQLSQGNTYEPTANGYLYENSGLGKVAIGTVTNPSSSTANVSAILGFKPKYLCVWYSSAAVLVYDERKSTTQYFRCASTPSFDATATIGANVGNTINSINSDGFTIRSSNGRTWNYFAIG